MSGEATLPDASSCQPNCSLHPAPGKITVLSDAQNSFPTRAADSTEPTSLAQPPPSVPEVLPSRLPPAEREPAQETKATVNMSDPQVAIGKKVRIRNVCPMCRGGGRNLVVCIDGTSNQFGRKNTNVVELYSRLVKNSAEQLTFYDSGIGTYARPSWQSLAYYLQVISNFLDLAFALRFEKIILSAYAWLADNYVEGDQIFLFGFSRGAYQVRALSAMIDTVGLIHKGNDDQIPFAYELYAVSGQDAVSHAAPSQGASWCVSKTLNLFYALFLLVFSFPWWLWKTCRTSKFKVVPAITDEDASMSTIDAQSESDESSQGDNELEERTSTMQDHFKKAFGRDVRVHFVGVWDTVSSVGLVRGKILPKTVDGMSHVCYFRHALALHERRVKFLPEYVRGGLGPDQEYREDMAREANQNHAPHTKEVWFPGSHSDVGGGASPNEDMRKFGPTLRWISFEAQIVGLRITTEPGRWQDVAMTNSLSPFWKLIEFLPVKRLTYDSVSGTTYRPHLWARRPIQPGQLIHDSVSRQEKATIGLQIEFDPYLNAVKILGRLKSCVQSRRLLSDIDCLDLMVLRCTALGQKQLSDIDRKKKPSENISKLLASMLGICEENMHERSAIGLIENILLVLYGLEYSFDVLRHSQPLHHVLGISAAKEFGTFPRALRRHKDPIVSLGCLRDGRHIVSVSWDQTINVWDAFTGQPLGEPSIVDTPGINCGAVSTDGKLVLGGYEFPSISLWDPETRAITHGPWYASDLECKMHCQCVAFSPNCERIASAYSSTLTLWDASTGQQIGYSPAEGIMFYSLSFSSDGQYLAEACNNFIQILKVDCPRWIWLPRLIGHNQDVRAVVWSPDDKLLVSGSEDGSVRVWRMDTLTVEHVMTGHTNGVLCMAFSPKGKYVVSGSRDRSVRIWNVDIGRAVGVPLIGHT